MRASPCACASPSRRAGWELRETLSRLAPELYEHAPGPETPFLDGVTNPCWQARAKSAAKGGAGGGMSPAYHCLPHGMVLGAFQAGSASHFQALSKHPHIAKVRYTRVPPHRRVRCAKLTWAYV